MPAAYVSEAHGSDSDGTITATFASAPASGNLLVACLFGYAEQLAHLAAPAAGLTWTERDTESDAGSTRFGKVWTATGDGATSSFVFRNTNGAFDYLGLIIIEVSGHDTTTPIDAIASGKSSSGDTTADCPSVSPTGSDSLLIGFACHNGFTAAARTCSWSAGAERVDFQRPDEFDNYTAMTQALAASGATGTRTSTVSGGGEGGWFTFSVAVKSAAGGAEVTGTINTNFGALTATAVATRTVVGTVATNFGGLTATATATRTVTGAISTNFGGLTATAAATRTVTGTISTSFGGLTATATGTVEGEEPPAVQEDSGGRGGGILGKTRSPVSRKPVKVDFDALPVWFKVVVHLEPTAAVVAVVSLDELAETGTSAVQVGRADLFSVVTQEHRGEVDEARGVLPYCVQHGERRHTGDSLERLNDDDEQAATAIARYLLARSHA